MSGTGIQESSILIHALPLHGWQKKIRSISVPGKKLSIPVMSPASAAGRDLFIDVNKMIFPNVWDFGKASL